MSIFAKCVKAKMPAMEEDMMEAPGAMDPLTGDPAEAEPVVMEPSPAFKEEDDMMSAASKEEVYEVERRQSGYAQEEPEIVIDDDTGEVEIEGDDDGDDVLGDIDRAGDEAEVIEMELKQLIDASSAIESFGVNPTAIGIMKATGLLSGTALESIALESFSIDAANGAESQMAMEALGEKIKETAAKWSAKILMVIKDSGAAVMGVLSKIWEKISSATKALTSAAWDKMKEAGKIIKAHPYATVAAVVTAIVAVGAVVSYASGSFPALGAKSEMFASFNKRFAELVERIKYPFANFKTTMVGEKLSLVVEKVKGTAYIVKEMAVDKLGWTRTSVAATGQHLSRAWTAVKDGIGSLAARGAKLAGSMKIGSEGAVGKIGDFFKMFASHVSNLVRLIREVAIGGFNTVLATFRKLASAVNAKYMDAKWDIAMAAGARAAAAG